MGKVLSLVNGLSGRNDMMVAFLLVLIIMMMILPLPTFVVDILIAVNMGLAAILLMVAIYLISPLEFIAFPSVLLLTTLFRLSLSITTTRLILLEGDAGAIITTFGDFVVGGNLIVGLVLFSIITIVQFVVITKGSERVAEVSARFSLDGMPGKQISIDSDMRAGLIDLEEAKSRRQKVEKESQLYGSLDGAMKFVKGDAIAGIIITVVNILGGIAIGVLQGGLSAGEALEIYAILTIGDGLVAQIPALIISITAGIIVTRVTTEESKDLGNDITNQVFGKPKALYVGSALMLGFALIPGFPWKTFVVLSAITGVSGFVVSRRVNEVPEEDDLSSLNSAVQPEEKGKLSDDEEFTFTLPLTIELSQSLQQVLDLKALNNKMLQIRRSLYMDLGIPFPGIHLKFTNGIGDEVYRVNLHETPVSTGQIKANYVLVDGHQDKLDLFKMAYEEGLAFLPSFQPFWVNADHVEQLDKLKIGYYNLEEVLTYHLSFILRKYAADFVGLQQTRFLLEKMEVKYGELTKEVQRVLPLQKIADVLRRLVSEGVSIRNLTVIMESLIEWGQKEKDYVLLAEYVRTGLKRYISYKHTAGRNVLPAYMLDEELEERIRGAIRQTSAGSYLAVEPAVAKRIIDSVIRTVGDISQVEHKPVIITALDIRRYVRKLIETDLYELSVLSFQELTQEIVVQPIARIDL